LENHKTIKKIFAALAIFLCLLFFLPAAKSHHDESHNPPLIYSITPQFIPQGQTTTVIVTGENLPSIVGVDGDIFAVILKKDKANKSLTIQLSASPTALGPKNLILRNEYGVETTFPFQVIPSGSPQVENIEPNIAYPGDTILARMYGKNLTSPFIAALSEQLLIISSRPTNDGSVVDLTISVNQDIQPGTYPIIISTPYGQSEIPFTILNSSNKTTSSDYFNPDPYSPGIFSVEFDQLSKTVTIKGSMFDPNPLNNIVTLLENSDGSVIGRQVEISYADNNEIVINLPDGITSDSLSFAVSNSEGRSSNIKTVSLEPITETDLSDTTTTDQSEKDAQADTSAMSGGGFIDLSTTVASSPVKPVQQDTVNLPKDTQTHDQNKPADKPVTSVTQGTTELIEDPSIVQNVHNLTQYLLSSTEGTKKEEISEPRINEIKDPAKIISTIEETKQIKDQADLIMLALDNAKDNVELLDALKRSETLKSKVDELEKLLSVENQKHKPDQKKLAQYQKLLASASAESKSKTFELLNNLLKYKPQLKNLFSQKPFDLAAIQPNIPDDSIILQYVPTEEGLIIFAVDNKNLKTRINKNITKDILNREVQAYRQLFEKEIEKIKLTGRVTPILSWKANNTNLYKKEIRPLKLKSVFLYNALIEPVERDITGKKNIAIIANGWLRYLPFQSLAKLTEDDNLKFLIADKSITYLDSVIAVSKNSSTALNNKSLITVFANPDGSLNGANKEAEIITKLFSKTVTSLVQRSFNIPLINEVSKKADILHLATHGYLDSKNIQSSYLVSGKKQNSKSPTQTKIFLKDIYDLNLSNCKLVVLSGCDTGTLGSLSGEPDDIVGSLATAFRVAGANTILASLWKAHDEATKVIMQNFYQNLKSGQNKAESLRKAQLALKENPQYSHPLFWSVFNLIGDWR